MKTNKINKFVYIVMMNLDPMGSYPDWQPFCAFLERKAAQAHLNKMWKEQWCNYARSEIPVEKGEWFRIDKVRMG